jgi:small GTP-binding protein
VAGYVAIIGLPNAGKSTMLNCLLGQKLSIVTRKAQTTRDRVVGIISEDDYQIIMLDTPGIIKASKPKSVGRPRLVSGYGSVHAGFSASRARPRSTRCFQRGGHGGP